MLKTENRVDDYRQSNEVNDESMLLSDVREKYLAQLAGGKNCSNETIRSYKTKIGYLEEYLIRKFNGPVYLDDITFHDLDSFIIHMSTERKWKPNSVKQCHYALRAFFSYCQRKELIKKNIAEQMEPVNGERKEREHLSKAEFDRLENAIKHPLVKKVVVTLFYSGMRISECLNLVIADVDLNKNVIKVREAKNNTFREIPLHRRLKELLEDHLKDLNLQDPFVRKQRLFATKTSGKITAAYVNQIIGKAKEEAGLHGKVTAHTLRHSFASRLIKKNCNLVYVQKLLGHADLRTTSIYTHAKMDDLVGSVDLL